MSKLSVLQWNIYYKEDPRNVVELIKNLNPDIVCIQELTLNAEYQTIKDVPAYIAKELGYDYYCKDLPLETEIFANGIFSRYPIVDKKFAWINQPKGDVGYDDEFRAYVEVGIKVGDDIVYIGTVHMSYTHRFEVTPNKRAETDILVESLKKHDSKFVFTGDLNAVPGYYTINRISEVLQPAGPSDDQKTWTTKPFSYNGFDATELTWRLDHVFATSDLKVVSSEIIKTDYSDHLPILTVFKS